ncbi:MAG: prepilin-type N-terminal cleavage/methylation domain-containing protein [Actinomycetota bacterium]
MKLRSPDSRAPEAREAQQQADRGFTLLELLISTTLSGVLIVAIATAFTVMLSSQGNAGDRLAISKDVTFVQTWLPLDLSSALETTDLSDETELDAELASYAAPIGDMSYNHTFVDSTNVLTIVRPDLERYGDYFLVTYRYEQRGEDWRLIRYEIRNPGTASETISVVGVAHELPAPPEPDPSDPSAVPWQHGDPATHAVEVTSRNQVILRPIGEDVTVNFENGDSFTTGGAGLSAENELPTNYSGQLIDPSAPPSRCGGRVAILLDTSGSVPIQNGGEDLKDAAVGFLDNFTGTPVSMQVIGFDYDAYVMTSGDGNLGTYFSMLNEPAKVQAAKDRITGIPNQDGSWSKHSRPNGTGAGAYWWEYALPTTTNSAATNWEAGIWDTTMQAVAGGNAPLHPLQPDLIVFVTDGEPNLSRRDSDLSPVNESTSSAVREGQEAAEIARSAGARLVGILVGNKADDTGPVNNIESVVGENRWDGTVDNAGNIIDIGNAASADLFLGNFDQLGGVLRSIMIAECGGTVTLQKKIDTGSSVITPTSGVWQYTTSVGTRELDRDKTSSITFDYSFEDGEVEQWVQITESVVPGYTWQGADCRADGNPLTVGPESDPASEVRPNDDGSPGVTVKVKADRAISCRMISTPN